MKKSIAITAAAALVLGGLFTACNSSEKKIENANEKIEDAKEDIADAHQDIAEAKIDSLEDYTKFRAKKMEEITKNEGRIAEYRLRMDASTDKAAKTQAKKDADALEKRNKEMKKRLEDSKEDSDWKEFKREFNHDMDQLGKSISDLFKDNKN